MTTGGERGRKVLFIAETGPLMGAATCRITGGESAKIALAARSLEPARGVS